MKTCEKFIAFERAPEVCDSCGQLFENHSEGARAQHLDTEYSEALMRTIIKLGGIHCYYGGMDTHKTDELRKHMKSCKISWKDSSLPAITSVPEFDGTFNDSTYIEVIGARLTCTCDRQSGFYFQEIVIMDLTMGQLIWHVVRA